MSKQLPALQVDAACPKCGCEDVSLVYHEAGEHGAGLCPDVGFACKGAPEYMKRTCQRCHYGWREEPLGVGTQ